MNKKPLGIEYLKQLGPAVLIEKNNKDAYSSAFASLARSKGYNPDVFNTLARAGLFGQIFSNLVLRVTGDTALEQRIDALLRKKGQPRAGTNRFSLYRGLSEQNTDVSLAIKESPHQTNLRNLTGEQTARLFYAPRFNLFEQDPLIGYTPVTIIGGGPAGIMVARAMIEIGWEPSAITFIDKSGKFGGIWNYSMVAGATRNNPFDLQFMQTTLARAPGSGTEVVDFIGEMKNQIDYSIPDPIKAHVTCVEPHDFATKVFYDDGLSEESITAPIVINTLGNGKPLPISCKGRMTTRASPQQAGLRWQQLISEEKARELDGKRVLCIGLGNSTGEMMVQFEHWNRQGYAIDYKILTHFPAFALDSPDENFITGGKTYRVFRDLTRPTLVDFTGDLPEYRSAYFNALHARRIIPDVDTWNVKGKTLQYHTSEGEKVVLP